MCAVIQLLKKTKSHTSLIFNLIDDIDWLVEDIRDHFLVPIIIYYFRYIIVHNNRIKLKIDVVQANP